MHLKPVTNEGLRFVLKLVDHLLAKLTARPTNISRARALKPVSSLTIRKKVFTIRKKVFTIRKKIFRSYKKVFVTKLVTLVTNFVTRVTKFVIYISKFVINFSCADGEKYQGLREIFQGRSKKYLP